MMLNFRIKDTYYIMEVDEEVTYDRSVDQVRQVIEMAKLEDSDLHSYSQVCIMYRF